MATLASKSGPDPCRLARQVNEIGELADHGGPLRDPCRLARQVNQIAELRGGGAGKFFTCRTSRQGSDGH